MLSSTMQDALNAQINREQCSAQLYLAMSAHLSDRNYKGFAHWLRLQSDDETVHAMRLVDFVLDRFGTLDLRPVQAPPGNLGGVIQVFEMVLEHEKENTASIHNLFETARSEKDFASEITLQWYVTEQVREESLISAIVDHLRAIGDQGGAIWYLDHRMSKRMTGDKGTAPGAAY
jgi:ferritin